MKSGTAKKLAMLKRSNSERAHEIKKLREALAGQNDAIVDYVGGLTKWAHEVLQYMSMIAVKVSTFDEPNNFVRTQEFRRRWLFQSGSVDMATFFNVVFETALKHGFIEVAETKKLGHQKVRLTQCVTEVDRGEEGESPIPQSPSDAP